MSSKRLTLLQLFFSACVCLAALSCLWAQETCLTEEETKKAIVALKSPAKVEDAKQIRKELLDLADSYYKLETKAFANDKGKALIDDLDKLGETNLLRVCHIIRDSGWPSKEAIKDDGFAALQSIIRNNLAFALQRQLMPYLVEVAAAGKVPKPLLASLSDRIRTRSGLPQIFGTLSNVKDDIVYILPLLNADKVDEWRKQYDLPPMSVEMRVLEARFQLPVLMSQRLSGETVADPGKANKAGDATVLNISGGDSDTLKIETKLVNLNLRFLTETGKPALGLTPKRSDLSVTEDGVEQDVRYFSTIDEPFDLVLLLDFSGSTEDKRGMIKKAAQRFIASTRPRDRVGVVAFADQIQVVSPLTADKTAIVEKVKDIKVTGSSPIWESLAFTYQNVFTHDNTARRTAIVMMSDGLDNSRKATFSDAMEIVRNSDTTIFSIYVDTGSGSSSGQDIYSRFLRKGQTSLEMLADESGGQFYKADHIGDLDGIYDQVINDLATVYSLGYEPKNDAHDGGWRSLTVKLRNDTKLVAKTRRGYYAK